MTKTISKATYWQLVGLLALAKDTNSRLEGIKVAVEDIFEVSEEDQCVSGIGNPEHIADAMYSDYSATELLHKLGIKVVTGKPLPKAKEPKS